MEKAEEAWEGGGGIVARRGGGVGKLFVHAPAAISVVPVTTTGSARLSTTTTTLFWSILSLFFPFTSHAVRPRSHPIPPSAASNTCTSHAPSSCRQPPSTPAAAPRSSKAEPASPRTRSGATAPPPPSPRSVPQSEQGAMAPVTSQRAWHRTELKCK